MLPEKEIEVVCITKDVQRELLWFQLYNPEIQMLFGHKCIVVDSSVYWNNKAFTIREIDLDKLYGRIRTP
jgi:hypothetical protein